MRELVETKVQETDWTKLLAYVAIVQLILSWLKDAPIPEEFKPWLNSASTLLVQLIGFFLHQKKSPQALGQAPVIIQSRVEPPAPEPDPKVLRAAMLRAELEALESDPS